MPAKLNFRSHWLARYAAAVAAVGAGLLLRLALTAFAGEGLPTYITFYPAVMAVALFGGFGPGLAATAVAGLVADLWVLHPHGQVGIDSVVDAVGMAVFLGMGLFMSLVAELYRRARQRAAMYETKVPPWESQAEPPRPVTERLLLGGGIVLSLGILAVAGWQAHRNMAAMVEADRWVTHTYVVNEEIEHFLMALQDMQASVRAYVVSGQEDDLRRYTAALPEPAKRLAALKAQTQDNPAQTQRVVALEGLVEANLGVWKETIELRRAKGFEAAQALVATGKGRALTEEIQRLMDQAQLEEDRLLDQRTQTKEANLRRARQALLSGGVLGLLILGAVFIFLRQENAGRRQAQAELRRHRDHLQEIVAARTAELAQQREWLQVTLNSIGDAVLATDTAGQITFLNPVAEALTGWSEKEALGQPIQNVFRVINEDSGAPGEDITARALREGGVVALANHTALVRRDGRAVPIEDSAAPIRDSAGTVSGVVLVFHDVTEKRRVQAAMREAQQQNEMLANIIERSSQPFGMGYPDGRMGLVNRAFEQLTGYSAEELRDMDWAKVLTPPEWRDLERQKLEELHATGQPVRYEKEYLRKDGSRVPIELLVHLARDAEGQPAYYYSFLTDITERKRAEEALRQSEQFIKSVAAASPHWLYVFDLETRDLTYMNRSILRDLGYPPEVQFTVTGLDAFQAFMPPEEMPHLARLMEEWQSLPDGRVRGDEYRLRHADGTLRDFAGREIVFTRRPDGTVRRILGLLLDITDLKAAEEALRASEDQLRQRVGELQAANEEVQASRRAAMNLMDDAVRARKQTEEAAADARRAAEQRRLALEAADLGTWDYHFQAGEVFWDERCREMWGIAQADHISYAAVLGRIHPEDRAGVDKAVQEALAGRAGGAYRRQYRVVWPDGSVHWIAAHGHVYFEGEGAERRAVRFIGTVREITAEKQAQDALRESEERLAAFAAATFEGIILSDRGRIVDCNEQFAQMVGYRAEDLTGRSIEEFVAPEDRSRVMENIRAGRKSIIESQVIRRDGSRLTVEAHGQPGGTTRRGLRHTALRDITERKQRELLLAQLNRTLKALKDSSQAMMRATSESEYLNEVCRIVVEDCGHAMVWIGFAEDDADKSVRPVARAGFEEGYLESLHLTWADTELGRGPTGTAIRTGKPAGCPNMLTDPAFAPWRTEAVKRGYASSVVVPLLAEGGDASPRRPPRRALGAITIYARQPNAFSEDEIQLLSQLAGDVSYCIRALRLRAAKAEADRERERARTALQQSAEDLKRSNRDLEQFAYVASHDLQEPLRAVGGYVKLLERRLAGKLAPDAEGFIAGAFEGAVRMERLINDLLAFSRVGTRGGAFTVTDLNVALGQALANLQVSLASARANVTHDPLPTLTVDRTQFMQLFQNLIGNAIKFRGPTPPQVHVSAQQRDGRWVFGVRDNGIGIEPQYREKIFQIFQRLHTRKEYPGTGIGLAICKRIVERHGGDIWVESEPGQGTTFYFSLPEAKA